jgi:hypothetical protein
VVGASAGMAVEAAVADQARPWRAARADVRL